MAYTVMPVDIQAAFDIVKHSIETYKSFKVRFIGRNKKSFKSFQHNGSIDLCTLDSRCILSSEDIILEGLPKIRRLYQEMNGPDKEPVSIVFDK